MPPSQGSLAAPQYRADIDGLRGIAVLLVVGFHAFPAWVNGGFTGVDVFFVISGFLISTIIFGSLARDSFSVAEFYSRRIRRIFPALLLILIASSVFGWLVLLPDDYKQLGKQIAGGAGFVSNFVLWNESGYFDNAAETKPLLHLWSLGIEEQFYIIWPSLLWLGWKFRLNLLAVTLIVAAASFALNIAEAAGDVVADFFSPQTRFWELMAGSALAYGTFYRQRVIDMLGKTPFAWVGLVNLAQPAEADRESQRDLRSVLGLLLIAAGALLINGDDRFPGWWALLPTLGTALIISAGIDAWLNRLVLSNRALVWVGLISFPLYLWHWTLLSFARILEGETPAPEIRAAAVALSIVLAWLTYWLIERPIRFGKHAKAKTLALLVLMMAAGLTGYSFYERNGLTSRLPVTVQDLTQYAYDYKLGYRAGTCFLMPEQDYTAFSACEPVGRQGKRSILLWGDSHAAHLFPGYKASFGDSSNLIQRTASGCPPILDMDIGNRPYCRKINDVVFESIQTQRPEKIVLAARWELYDWKKVARTIDRLRKIGIDDIDLVGPVPRWKERLPILLYQHYQSDPMHRIPERMTDGLDQQIVQLDPVLAEFAREQGVNYLSPQKVLCDSSGCITRFGITGDTLTAWDYSHLTEIGSRFVVSNFPKD
jgi:peptidoglycan/LPS O-acetylase OafA/YrhL